MELQISDHKPVSSMFTLKVKTERPELRGEVYRDLIRQLDQYENDSLPKVIFQFLGFLLSLNYLTGEIELHRSAHRRGAIHDRSHQASDHL